MLGATLNRAALVVCLQECLWILWKQMYFFTKISMIPSASCTAVLCEAETAPFYFYSNLVIAISHAGTVGRQRKSMEK